MAERIPLPDGFEGHPFSVSQARDAGIPENRLRSRTLHTPFHGTRMPATDAVPSLAALCRAYLTRAAPDVLIAHVTAAELWGIALPARYRAHERIHVVHLDGVRAPRGQGVAGHKTHRPLEPSFSSGVRLTSPRDSLFLIANALTLDELVVAGESLLSQGRENVTLPMLRREATAWPGARSIRKVRLALDLMRVGSRSPRETSTRLAIVAAGLPEPEINAAITLSGGLLIHGDLVFRSHRVLVEYEGDHHRTSDVQWSRDLRRYNKLSQAGWIVLRVSKSMPDAEVVALVRRALTSRS